MKATAQIGQAFYGVLAVLTCCLVLHGVAIGQGPRVNQDALALKEFTSAVQKYVQLRKQLLASLKAPKQTEDLERIKVFLDSLAQKIQTARAQSKEGDIFTPASAIRIRRLVTKHFQGAHASESKETIRKGEPVKIMLRLNERYPESVPLTTVPATLLQNLPQLPPEVEYGIVNKDLVLLDAQALVMLDAIRDALP